MWQEGWGEKNESGVISAVIDWLWGDQMSAAAAAVAVAKSLQSCPTVRPHKWQPIRLPSPWDSPGKNTGVGYHFLLQCRKWKVKVKSLSGVRPSATPWTAAFQASPSMGFSRQECWSGVPFQVYLFPTCIDSLFSWTLFGLSQSDETSPLWFCLLPLHLASLL